MITEHRILPFNLREEQSFTKYMVRQILHKAYKDVNRKEFEFNDKEKENGNKNVSY